MHDGGEHSRVRVLRVPRWRQDARNRTELAKSRKKDTMQQQQQQQQQQNIAPQSQRFSSQVQVRDYGVIPDVRNLADHPKILAELEKVKASRAAMELYQALIRTRASNR